jgi:hypothetical protein
MPFFSRHIRYMWNQWFSDLPLKNLYRWFYIKLYPLRKINCGPCGCPWARRATNEGYNSNSSSNINETSQLVTISGYKLKPVTRVHLILVERARVGSSNRSSQWSGDSLEQIEGKKENIDIVIRWQFRVNKRGRKKMRQN